MKTVIIVNACSLSLSTCSVSNMQRHRLWLQQGKRRKQKKKQVCGWKFCASFFNTPSSWILWFTWALFTCVNADIITMRPGTGQRLPQFRRSGLQHSAIYWWQTDMYVQAHYITGIYLKAFPLDLKIKTNAFSAIYTNIHKYTCVTLHFSLWRKITGLLEVYSPKHFNSIVIHVDLNKHAIFFNLFTDYLHGISNLVVQI